VVQGNIIQTIHRALANMRRSEQKVAQYVLHHSHEVISLRIVDLASRAQVSEPTVVRFCRAIDCEGFQDFKLKLAQQLPQGEAQQNFTLSDSDSAAEFSNKVFDSTIDILKKVRDSIDPKAIENAVAALCQANRVEFYGYGASAAVAADAQHKFFRLQMSTAAYSDPHIQNMSAMSLGKDDVVIAISQSGRTKALLDSVALVKEGGGTVIGLAPGGTPLFNAATIPIHIDVEEDTESYTPLSSRIAHLVVIDILAVGVSQRRGPDSTRHLEKLKHGLRSLRVNDE
jgi:RpiR family carbohydrate utilization transcriptional regulator